MTRVLGRARCSPGVGRDLGDDRGHIRVDPRPIHPGLPVTQVTLPPDVDRLGPVVLALAILRIGQVGPVVGAVAGGAEPPSPVLRGGQIGAPPQQVQMRGRIAHLDVRLLAVEVVAQGAMMPDVLFDKCPIAKIAALVPADVHAPHGGVGLDPPQVRVIVVEITARVGVHERIPTAD